MRQVRRSLFLSVGGLLCLALATWSAGYGAEKPNPEHVKRGHYLVLTHACGDCHTPWKMGANGPEPDSSRLLSGHPQALIMPATPALQGPWMGAVSGTFTAWAGPWGTSFSRNLTPDKDTGLGSWTEENFISTMRTGREMGKGRMILPPMPVGSFSHMTDQDLKDMYAYLQSIPSINNKVPDPIAPTALPPGTR